MHTTGTEGRLPAAAGVIAHVAETAATVDALSGTRIVTVSICDALRAFCTIVDTEGCLLTAACIIGRITGHAGGVDTLLSIAIAVGTTGDARAAVVGTEGCIPTTSGAVGRVAGNAGFVDTLADAGVSAIEVGATANAA